MVRRMLTVPIVLANQPYQLSALLLAVDAKCPIIVSSIELDFDPDAGAARLYIGNSDVAINKWGVKMSGGQFYAPPPLNYVPGGSEDLSTWYLLSDVGGVACGVTVTG